MNSPKSDFSLTKFQLIIGVVLGVMTPTAAGVASYYKAISDLAPKAEVEKMRDKIDRIAEDVSEIKGLLRGLRERQR